MTYMEGQHCEYARRAQPDRGPPPAPADSVDENHSSDPKQRREHAAPDEEPRRRDIEIGAERQLRNVRVEASGETIAPMCFEYDAQRIVIQRWLVKEAWIPVAAPKHFQDRLCRRWLVGMIDIR